MPKWPMLLHRLVRNVRRPRTSPAVLAWVAVIGLAMLFVWQQASVDRLLVDLERAQEKCRQLEGEVSALSMEADQLSSLAQVESRAMRELGLVRPATRQIVRLDFEDAETPLTRFPLGSIVPDATAAPRPQGDDR